VFHGEALTTTGPSSVTAYINVLASNDALVDARLRETGLAMLNYESAKANLPLDDLPATNFDGSGNPYLSWRVHVLPFMGYQALYSQFRLNEPWNSAHNLPLASKMPDIFRTPGDAASSTSTRLQLISGEGEPYYLRRVSGRLVGPRLQQVTDGTTNTILVVESGANQAVTWTKPDDLEFVAATPLSALGTLSGRIKAVTMDGAVRTFSSSIAPADFAALVTVSGGELVDAGTLAREYAAAAGLPANEAATDNALKQVALAVLNYESAKKVYPVNAPAEQRDAAGNPLLSWRVHILPYMGYQELYSRFHLDEAWNSANNLPLLAEMPDVFRSVGDAATSTTTRMQTFYGAGAPFRPATALKASQISDGHANTIMIMEVGGNVAVPWTQPADVAFNGGDPRAGLGTLSSPVRAVFFDGHVGKLPTDLDGATWTALATNAGGELVDAGTLEARERQRAGDYDRPSAEQSKYKQLILAMLDFEDARARFPANTFAADGTPLLSWRVHILPYLGYQELFNKFRKDEPWNSAWNLALLDEMPDLFRAEGEAWDSYTTRAQTFVGPAASGAPFPSSGTSTTTGITQASITDGSSNTFAIVKAGRGNGVPWTKPADVLFDANNPFSALGDVGPTILAAFFDGSVRYQNGAMSLGQLKAYITRNGGEDINNPPAITPTPDINIHETGGDTRFNEYGADAFDLVLESPPTGDVTVTVDFDGNAGFATLDRTSLVFTPANWNKPQRVVVRGVDDHVVNSDRALLIQVEAEGYVQKKNLPVRMLNDDLPALRGDFNDDTEVDGRDFLAWQRSAGMGWNATRPQGDADADKDVDTTDLSAWAVEFGGLAAGPSADFDGSGQVNGADLAAWRGGFGTAMNATPAVGDADLDQDVDGRDFLAWQQAFGGGGGGAEVAVASAAGSASSGANAAALGAGELGLDMLSGLPGFEAADVPAQAPRLEAEAVAPELSLRVRDALFGSMGGMGSFAGGRWELDAERGAAAGEVGALVDGRLEAALGLGETRRFFSRAL
jgi:hypothetical protein